MLSDRTINALTGISKATLQNGVRIKHLFRIMTHCPDLWIEAYAKIYANKGAVTKGVNQNTLDGMCIERVESLIALLKDGRYKPMPARRVYIPKKNGKTRPLGMPTGDDKLVQEVVRILLEQVYESVFSDKSHGFRPAKSCHTALEQIDHQWKGVKWIVDMDIQGFYDNIDHSVLIAALEKKIDDKKFINLIKLLLKAGYLEDWKFHGTYSGTPQGGICSPILANIVLHELDQFMETKIAEFNKGEKRKRNPEYFFYKKKIKWQRTLLERLLDDPNHSVEAVEKIRSEMKRLHEASLKLPSGDPSDEGFKRLFYARYADDFVIGVIGSHEEAKAISRNAEEFLNKNLSLKIASDKSGIHSIKDGFDFLGYHISLNIQNKRHKKVKTSVNAKGRAIYVTRRTLGSKLHFQIPKQNVWAFCQRKGYLGPDLKPARRPELLNLSDFEIVSTFNAEMRGFANYYKLAGTKENLYIIEWAGIQSLFKTLGNKYKCKTSALRKKMKRGNEIYLRYEWKGKTRELKVFKMKHLSDDMNNAVVDKESPTKFFQSRTEIVQRMAAGKCEYCGKTGGYFEVHHVRKLKDIMRKKTKEPWEIRMCGRLRKTMVLCTECHNLLHAGKLQGWRKDINANMESVVQ